MLEIYWVYTLGVEVIKEGDIKMPTKSNDYMSYMKLTIVSIIWGGTFIAGRFISFDIGALLLASLRFIFAAAVLVLILFFSKKGFVKINKNQMMKIIFLGFFGIYVYNICFFYGLKYIDASRASLIVAINPVVIAIFSYFFFRERLPAISVGGIILCLLGAGFVIVSNNPLLLESGNGSMIGDISILGCVISWVIYSVFCKKTVNEIGALHTVAYSVLAGAIMLTVTVLVTGEMNQTALSLLSFSDLISLIYLGVVGSAIAYILYYDGIDKIGATRAGVFIALNPLTAVLGGMLFLGEKLTTTIFMGAVFIIAGIFIANKRGRDKNNPLKISDNKCNDTVGRK
ncbi:DMT family transporter [Xenorhabdus nematophila]|uniref:DMT family transporter n=2 Tax=Xenorhabdus nematophila TaxID=628 RepID=UPI001F410362|nr:EamA family transporter [Xenorhabdus nematophila]